MAGLMQGGMAPPGGMNGAPATAMPPEGAGQRRKATPGEQRLHDDFIANAINVAYEPEFAKQVVKMLSDEEQPPAASLAQVIDMVVSKVKADAEGNGIEVPDAIVARAAAKVASSIATELAPAAGLGAIDQQQMHAAYYEAMERMAVARQQREHMDARREMTGGENLTSLGRGLLSRMAPTEEEAAPGNGAGRPPPRRFKTQAEVDEMVRRGDEAVARFSRKGGYGRSF